MTTTPDTADILHLCTCPLPRDGRITITDGCRCYEGEAAVTESIPAWINEIALPF